MAEEKKNPKDFSKDEWKNWKKNWDGEFYHRHQGSGFGALILIAIGILFLLNNFGIVTPQVWNVLWRFWPSILIIWGIRMILGRNIITGLISLAIILFVVFLAISTVNSDFSMWMQHYFPWWQTPPQMMMYRY